MARKKLKKKKTKTKKTRPADFGLKRKIRMESLDPAKVPRVRKELVETDYIKKLNPEEKRWLAQFTNEYVGGAIEKDDNGRVKKGHLHSTKALAKDCYDSNNRRNNDVHGVTKANGLLYNVDQIAHDKDGWYISNPELTEDAVIAIMEQKENKDSNMLSFEEFLKLKENLTKRVREFYEKHYASRLK